MGDGDSIEFSVDISTAGNYQIKAGVRSSATDQNSFFAEINGGGDQQYLWEIPADGAFSEVFVSDRNTGIVTVTLNAGVHTLQVHGREAGAQLDWIEFELLGGGGTCNGLTVDVDLNAGDTPTSGDDVILGTSGADTINGLGGNDTICSPVSYTHLTLPTKA